MKLHMAAFGAAHIVTARGDGWIAINGQKHEGGVAVCARKVFAWPAESAADFHPQNFAPLAAEKPEIVLLGAGPVFAPPQPEWLWYFGQIGIGVEVMDTAAACRTYNILAAEGRDVLAALAQKIGGG